VNSLENLCDKFLGWCNPIHKVFYCLKRSKSFCPSKDNYSLWRFWKKKKFPRQSTICESARSYFLCLGRLWPTDS